MSDRAQAAQAAADDAFTAAMTAAGYGSNGIMLRALSAALAAARPHLEAAERERIAALADDMADAHEDEPECGDDGDGSCIAPGLRHIAALLRQAPGA